MFGEFNIKMRECELGNEVVALVGGSHPVILQAEQTLCVSLGFVLSCHTLRNVHTLEYGQELLLGSQNSVQQRKLKKWRTVSPGELTLPEDSDGP
jgi:hypothetical protein